MHLRILTQAEIQQSTHLVVAGMIEPSRTFLPGEDRPPMMADWDWYQGVALFGLYRCAQATGDEALFAYLTRWFDAHMKQGLPAININSVCPLLTLSFLAERTGNPAYFALCEDWLERILTDFARTTEQGFQHVTRDSANVQQLWADTLYMTVLFVARMGRLLSRDDCVQESVRQFLLHVKYLQDTRTGLFYHGFSFLTGGHFADAFWGRGNAWYTAGVPDYLELCEVPGGVRAFLLSALRRQADALLPLQTADGMWHTLLDEPETSYAEASATAGFAYGLLTAVRKGDLPQAYAASAFRAAAAVLGHMDAQGVLQQVSAGTCLRDTRAYYRAIPLQPQPYGQALALLMLTELAAWPEERRIID